VQGLFDERERVLWGEGAVDIYIDTVIEIDTVRIMAEIRIEYVFPTSDEFVDIYNSLIRQQEVNQYLDQLKKLTGSRVLWNILKSSEEELKRYNSELDFPSWLNNLRTMIYDAHKAYCLSHYYFKKGIPDEPISISPGRGGESVQYFPNFEDAHYSIQDMFRFFAELMVTKVFTALDNCGQLLNLKFFGQPERIYFHTAVKKVIKKNQNSSPALSELNKIVNSKIFEEAKKRRDDLMHNRSPFLLNSSFQWVSVQNGRGFGLVSEKNYIPAKETLQILDNLYGAILLPVLLHLPKALQ
jgi:hypothetical protein